MVCTIHCSLWFQCFFWACTELPYRNMVFLVAIVRCSCAECQLPRLHQGLSVKEGKYLLLGLPYIHSTSFDNQCRNHPHILHLGTVRGTFILNPNHLISQRRIVNLKWGEITYVGSMEGGGQPGVGLPTPALELFSCTIPCTYHSLTLDEFWSLKCDA